MGSRRIDLQIDRLYWRAGFGPSPADRSRARRDGVAATRERLLHGGSGLRGRPARIDGRPLQPYDRYGHDVLWWLDRMVRTTAPLAGADGVQPPRPLRDLERQGRRRAPDASPLPRAAPALAGQLLEARPRHGEGPRDAVVARHDRVEPARPERELRARADGAVHARRRPLLRARRPRGGAGVHGLRLRLGPAPVPLEPGPPRRRRQDGVRPPRPLRAGRRGQPLPAPSGPRAVLGAQAVELLHRHAALGCDHAAAGADLSPVGLRAAAGAADDPRLARVQREPRGARSREAAGGVRRRDAARDPPARRHRLLDVAAVEHGPAAVLPAERGRLADERGVADDAVGQGAGGRRGAPAVAEGRSSSPTRPSSGTRSRPRRTPGPSGPPTGPWTSPHTRRSLQATAAHIRPAGDWDDHAAAERRRVLRLLLLAGPDAQVC